MSLNFKQTLRRVPDAQSEIVIINSKSQLMVHDLQGFVCQADCIPENLQRLQGTAHTIIDPTRFQCDLQEQEERSLDLFELC